MNRVIRRVAKYVATKKSTYLDDFIFIHINKTGGTSIEKALGIPFEHKTALEKISDIGQRRWDTKLTFTVIRNPWDKVVSHYHYRIKTNQTGLRDKPIEFTQWVKRAYGENDPKYYDKPKMFMPQTNWIADEKGKILVDEVIRFENIEIEFNLLMTRLGINTSLPHTKKSNRGCYRNYYDDEAEQLVRHFFAQDIKRFCFRF